MLKEVSSEWVAMASLEDGCEPGEYERGIDADSVAICTNCGLSMHTIVNFPQLSSQTRIAVQTQLPDEHTYLGICGFDRTVRSGSRR